MDKKPAKPETRLQRILALALKISYVAIGVINAILAIGVIAVSVITAVALQVLSSDTSGRLVGLTVLVVTAAVTLALIIYSVIGLFRKNRRPIIIHAATIALVILAIIQALVCGLQVRVSEQDEAHLSGSLLNSFQLFRNGNTKQLKRWATTQSQLNCCGLYSPEDYRNPRVVKLFAPDVPIACCPSYSPDRSDLVQEIQRQTCKIRGEFYRRGCKGVVINVLKESAELVLHTAIALIIFEVIYAVLGEVISRKSSGNKGDPKRTDVEKPGDVKPDKKPDNKPDKKPDDKPDNKPVNKPDIKPDKNDPPAKPSRKQDK